jgi:acyl carrier protein
MDRASLVRAVAESIAEVLKSDLPALTERTRLFEDLHLDSTTILELLMALEDRVGMEVDPESLNMDDYVGEQLALMTG